MNAARASATAYQFDRSPSGYLPFLPACLRLAAMPPLAVVADAAG